jgi:Glycoside-hydrolase family GH114
MSAIAEFLAAARRGLLAAAAVLAGVGLALLLWGGEGRGAEELAPPPANAGFDYQIGGDYPLPAGVSVVSRDWFIGEVAAQPAYSICYVNAFQTQADEGGVDRPDERSNWPRGLVLHALGDDPKWGGEYLVDIRDADKRRRAADWVQQMIEGCDRKGFAAVEYDNLDSWTRFDGTPLERRVPFGRVDALAFARMLARRAYALGLAVGQKNTADITITEARRAGFDFAVAEECARFDECDRYRRVHGDRVIVIEYRRRDFREACRTVGAELSVVLRDRQVSRPGSRRYTYDAC